MKIAKQIRIYLLIVSVLIITGCAKEAVPEQQKPNIDKKAKEASDTLFKELGINEADVKPTDSKKALPEVLPTPPILPATDADLGIPDKQ